MKNLGFGMMRLPVKSGPTDFDYEELNKMVDEFLNQGFTYFDTSYVYHNGKSQEAVRKALVERHPRNSFTVATKYPTFLNIPEEKVDETFESQLKDLGVEYIDYYLIHNIQNVYYDGLDGKGGVVKTTHLFEHAKKWKEEAEKILKDINPDKSITSWSLRFAEGLEGVIAVLSGMSNLEQVKDNTKISNESMPLNDKEKEVLKEAMRIYRESAPIKQSEIDKYKGLTWHNVPVTAILQAYSICQIQPDPGFADDNNYFKNAILEEAQIDITKEIPNTDIAID